MVFGRLGLSALMLYALVRLTGRRLEIPWFGFLVMGTLNNAIPFTLIAWARRASPAGSPQS
jgi:drug/metabolite transporter (DMT)-like permease